MKPVSFNLKIWITGVSSISGYEFIPDVIKLTTRNSHHIHYFIPSCLGTHRNPPALASQILGLEACTTMLAWNMGFHGDYKSCPMDNQLLHEHFPLWLRWHLCKCFLHLSIPSGARKTNVACSLSSVFPSSELSDLSIWPGVVSEIRKIKRAGGQRMSARVG